VRAYALVELGDSEAIDLFLREEDARRALDEALRDEPDWIGLLYVGADRGGRAGDLGELGSEPEPRRIAANGYRAPRHHD
jgi:hypothetical protein